MLIQIKINRNDIESKHISSFKYISDLIHSYISKYEKEVQDIFINTRTAEFLEYYERCQIKRVYPSMTKYGIDIQFHTVWENSGYIETKQLDKMKLEDFKIYIQFKGE